MCRDAERAKDVLQEAFLRAWRFPKTPGEPDDFRPWLYRIMLNLIRDHYRRQRRAREVQSLGVTSYNAAEEAERRYEKSTLAQALQKLSRSDQEVIYLRFFDDASSKQLARILGAPEVAVRVRLHR